MTHRLEYMDSLRGFAMLLVVICHVLLTSFIGATEMAPVGEGNLQLLTAALTKLMVPLFFMISGFFAYRYKEGFSGNNVGRTIAKSFTYLVVPACLFILIRCWINQFPVSEAFCMSYKYGYWFTLTLFLFVLIYQGVLGILNLVKIEGDTPKICVLGIIALLLLSSSAVLGPRMSPTLFRALGVTHFHLFVYYLFGILMHRYFDAIYKYLSSRYLLGGGVILWFFICLIYSYGFCPYRVLLPSSTLYDTIYVLCGLTICFAAWQRYPLLSNDKPIGKFLKLVGRRTLDVYFLHYFFIPQHLQIVHKFFLENPNPYLEYLLATAMAVLVIFGALAVSGILRLSPILGRWLLGAKFETAK